MLFWHWKNRTWHWWRQPSIVQIKFLPPPIVQYIFLQDQIKSGPALSQPSVNKHALVCSSWPRACRVGLPYRSYCLSISSQSVWIHLISSYSQSDSKEIPHHQVVEKEYSCLITSMGHICYKIPTHVHIRKVQEGSLLYDLRKAVKLAGLQWVAAVEVRRQLADNRQSDLTVWLSDWYLDISLLRSDGRGGWCSPESPCGESWLTSSDLTWPDWSSDNQS